MELQNNKKKNIVIACIAAVVIILILWGSQLIMRKTAMDAGVDYLNQKEYEKALTRFEQAEKKYTIFLSKKDIQYYEGECLLYLGRYGESAKVYNKIATHYKEARAYTMEGFSNQLNGKKDKALQNYRKAIKEHKEDGIGYYYLYGYYIENKQYDKALSIIENAQKANVVNMKQEIAYGRIVAYEKLTQYDKALGAAKEYCKAYPDDKAGIREKQFLETR